MGRCQRMRTRITRLHQSLLPQASAFKGCPAPWDGLPRHRWRPVLVMAAKSGSAPPRMHMLNETTTLQQCKAMSQEIPEAKETFLTTSESALIPCSIVQRHRTSSQGTVLIKSGIRTCKSGRYIGTYNTPRGQVDSPPTPIANSIHTPLKDTSKYLFSSKLNIEYLF